MTEEVGISLSKTLKQIEKRYGSNTVVKASSIEQPGRISTGVFMIDFCLLGGIPINRITQLVGQKHSGKSLLASKIVASAQKAYPEQVAVWIDVENAYDATWAKKLGVDTEKLLVVHPETGESALDIMDALLGTDEVGVLVFDSIAAIAPSKEIDSSMEDQHMGLQSRMMTRALRTATAALIKERKRGHLITPVMINQFRAKIGGWSPNGDPQAPAGGKAIGFFTSLEIILKNKEIVGKDSKDIEMMVENEHAFKIDKNKMNSGPRNGEFVLRRAPNVDFGLAEGEIDDAPTMLAYAKKFGCYTGSGSSWTLSLGDFEQNFRGLDATVKYLYQNREQLALLRKFLLQAQSVSLGMPDSFIETIN